MHIILGGSWTLMPMMIHSYVKKISSVSTEVLVYLRWYILYGLCFIGIFHLKIL